MAFESVRPLLTQRRRLPGFQQSRPSTYPSLCPISLLYRLQHLQRLRLHSLPHLHLRLRQIHHLRLHLLRIQPSLRAPDVTLVRIQPINSRVPIWELTLPLPRHGVRIQVPFEQLYVLPWLLVTIKPRPRG